MFPDLSRQSHFSSALASGAGIDGASCRDDPDSPQPQTVYLPLAPAGDGPAVFPAMIATAIHLAAAAGLGGMAGLLGGLFGVGG